jgi:hypothetical protein
MKSPAKPDPECTGSCTQQQPLIDLHGVRWMSRSESRQDFRQITQCSETLGEFRYG